MVTRLHQTNIEVNLGAKLVFNKSHLVNSGVTSAHERSRESNKQVRPTWTSPLPNSCMNVGKTKSNKGGGPEIAIKTKREKKRMRKTEEERERDR